MNTRLLAIFFSASVSLPALAQDDASPLSPLFQCRAITDDAQRLACLDAAVDQLYASENSGEIIAVERAEIEAAEEATYGLNIPQFSLPRLPSVGLPSFSGGESDDLADAADTAAPGTSSGNDQTTAPTRRVERDDDGAITRISGLPVQNIERDAYDRMIITLQNGQVWRQIDDTRVLYSRRQPFTEMSVAVRSAALGSHMMQLNDRGRWFRVRREQ
ncbi:hypothetical protein V0U79_11585 [Hyphobacterium sp. HN65]|uniref:Uncharacterized protein n=1 Tax=Hyphobacterium lacteum TaxID=3116575 RepID=A0ABU7LSW7_9PROT|nr:hypothetical protein [Hyphobacterium sp. HN65]MEE2527012.1 hypothetical protein [Hyphobacterium sp. HN65]